MSKRDARQTSPGGRIRNPKRGALFQRLREIRVAAANAPPIARAGEEARRTLSLVEERFWFLDQLAPGDSTHNLVIAVRVRGSIEEDALRVAIEGLVARHESLRTRFISSSAGEPARVVDPPGPAPIEIVDLESTKDDETRRAAAVSFASRSFELAHGPIFRAALLRFGPTDHVLVLVTHHITADGWSVGVLSQDLGALYVAAREKRAAQLPELPIQYADFALWQREELTGPRFEEQLAQWKERLVGVPQLALPTDRPRSVTRTGLGAAHSVVIPASLGRALRDVALEERSTISMLLMSAFLVLLSRYSGQSDFIVGTVVANRVREETKRLIGCFVNTLALHAHVDGAEETRDLLGRVEEELLLAYAHPDVPLQRLVEALRAERDATTSPLPVLFVTEERSNEFTFGDALVEPFELALNNSSFDISLHCAEMPDRSILCIWHYASELFDASTIERMTGHFATLLEGLLGDPSRRVADLPILTDAERHRVLHGWNERRAGEAGCIHEHFEAQVARTPDASAVRFGDERLTFRQLNTRANAIARWLRRSGVGPEVLVGVCMERSPDLLAALIAVSKAGGGFVAFDKRYPQARLELMQREASVGFMICDSDDELPEGLRHGNVLSLARHRSAIDSEATENLDVSASPDGVAYVVFTSGSSGMPKGVLLAHRGLVDYVHAMRVPLGTSPEDVYLHTASFSFSSSVRQLFVPLVSGAEVMLASSDEVLDVGALATLIASRGVTCLDLVPSYLRAIVDELERSDAARSTLVASRLRQVALASEPLPAEVVARWFALFGRQFRVLNMYGQTETTGIVDTFPLERLPSNGVVPVGRPIATVASYILDAEMRPVPIGVFGELFIATSGLARGYLLNPELTATRFVPDPESDGGRMFRTGDMARFAADGTIEFRGRSDHQVKIRGFRVEPGDIEAALMRHGGVRKAIVVAREHAPGDNRIVAYVVPREPPLSLSDLRSYLKDTLPDYMVPSAFVMLDELPSTPNGKVDRRALPAPDFTASMVEFVPPRTPTEILLAEIWKDLLKVERVGADDSFFDLGGHSLLATRVVARIARERGVHVSLRGLFDTPELSKLASRIDQMALRSLPPPSFAALRRAPRDGVLPLAFGEEAFLRWHRVRSGGGGWSTCQPLSLLGPLDVDALQTALSELARRHETLRMSVRDIDGATRRFIADDWTALEIVDLTDVTDEAERQTRIATAADRMEAEPFDFENGPMMRVELLRFTPEFNALLLCTNHTAIDGAGRGVMLGDIEQLYAVAIGARPPLPELPFQLADYAALQREQAQGRQMSERIAFWERTLAGAEPMKLPTDRLHPEKRTFAVAHPFDFSRALVDTLAALAKKERATLFNVLSAALKVILHARSGQTDLIVGTPVSTREEHEELQGVAGNLVDHVLLRTDASGDPTFREFVRREAAANMEAFANVAPLSLVLPDAPSPMDHPLLHVLVNLFKVEGGAAAKKTPASNVRFESLDTPNQPRRLLKFDLLVTLVEGPWGCSGSFYGADDIFDLATVDGLVADYLRLLEGVAADPDRRIGVRI